MLHMFHICCNNIFQMFQLVLCCNKCFHVTSYKCFIWMLHVFHTYVGSVCSRCFIRFIRMLHLSVLCCSGIQGGAGSGALCTARAPGDEERRAGGRQTGRAACRCPANGARCGGRRSGHNGGRVHMRERNDLESKGTRRAARARRVV